MKNTLLRIAVLTAVALTTFSASTVQAQETPVQFQTTLDAYKKAASADCQSMDGGEFSMQNAIIYAVDLNGDGITDPIIDTHDLHCSASATLYGGASGGWGYDVFISDNGSYRHYEFLAENMSMISDAHTTVLLFTLHGPNCGISSPCYKAYFWADGEFRTADKIEQPIN